MLRSDPGRTTGFSATSTVPDVAGNCGRRPAIRRSTVDLPQPDGPRIATNSPLSGKSGTENVTSLMTVTVPNRFVTWAKSTTLGGCTGAAAGTLTSILDHTVRKQAALDE